VAKAKSVTPKKEGQPAFGEDPVVTLRLTPELTRQIDEWAEAHGEKSRSHAMRRLLGMALNTPMSTRKGAAK